MSADTGGSITQAAVYGKEENLCKFSKIKLKWQANNCSRFSTAHGQTSKMQMCTVAGFPYIISRLASLVKDMVWQQATHLDTRSAPAFHRGLYSLH